MNHPCCRQVQSPSQVRSPNSHKGKALVRTFQCSRILFTVRCITLSWAVVNPVRVSENRWPATQGQGQGMQPCNNRRQCLSAVIEWFQYASGRKAGRRWIELVDLLHQLTLQASFPPQCHRGVLASFRWVPASHCLSVAPESMWSCW